VTIDTTIRQPTSVKGSVLNNTSVGCFGDSTGSLTVGATGGAGGYTYDWSTGDTVSTLNNLIAGNYEVTITDSVGCTDTLFIVMDQPDLLQINIADSFNISCFGGANGSIDITITGGTLPYSFLWSNGITSEDNVNLLPGTYSVTVTDGNGCTATRAVTLEEPDSLDISGTVTNASCNFTPDGGIDVTITGGTPPYNYLWSNFANTQDLTNVTFGTYTVLVTDANGCTISESFIVNENSTLNVVGTISDVSCNGLTDGAIDLTVSGGSFPYLFKWSTGPTIEDVSNLAPGV
jgi:hypothetical protein